MYILHIVQGLWFTSRLLVGNEGSEKKVEATIEALGDGRENGMLYSSRGYVGKHYRNGDYMTLVRI